MSRTRLPLIDAEQGEWDEQALSRRGLLNVSFWAATSAVALVLVGTGTGFVVGDSLEPVQPVWILVGLIDELPIGQVHKTTYKMRSKDGWRTVERTGVLYAFSDDGATYTVLDAICPHTGCNVQWRDEQNQFRCPCHDAWFSREGEVISGPPPRPLAQLETKIEEGRLLALL